MSLTNLKIFSMMVCVFAFLDMLHNFIKCWCDAKWWNWDMIITFCFTLKYYVFNESAQNGLRFGIFRYCTQCHQMLVRRKMMTLSHDNNILFHFEILCLQWVFSMMACVFHFSICYTMSSNAGATQNEEIETW